MHANSLATLSRLLDEALDLPANDRPEWIEALDRRYDDLRPRLRALLGGTDAQHGASYLATIPKLTTAGLASGDWSCGEDGFSDRAPQMVGPYRLIERLGRGGMGTVWLAERADGLLKRPVALKLPRAAWYRPGLAERLAREREILASLNHPHIARLYDAGLTSDGQPFLALEYVDGRPIDEHVRVAGLSLDARLRLFLQVTRAVAHAHGRLVVHRDLKPSNILVTHDGEVKLLDFGIAKMLEADPDADGATTDVLGRPFTPDYASPEQIAGEPLGIATDVYSLGVVLYELMADVRPYVLRRDSRGALEEAILREDSKPPSDAVAEPARKRALRGDLDTIALKALKKRPDERYATVNALAEDIDRYLHSQPVLARPDSRLYRVRKFVARNTLAVGAAASIALVALAGAGAAAWQARVALGEKAHAEEVRDLLTTIFRDVSPYNGRGSTLSGHDWLKLVKTRVDARLDNRPALRIELLNIVGSSLQTMQDTAAAEAILTEAAREASSVLGPDHPETLRSRVHLTSVLRFRGKTRQMRTELDTLIPLMSDRPALFAEHLTIAFKNLAHLEIHEGRYQAAERSAQQGVAVGLERLGEQHPETVSAVLVRAYAYQFSRSPDEALKAIAHAFRLAQTTHDGAPRHPQVIEGRLLYGRALGEAGHLGEAVRQLDRAVRDAAEVFGPSSRMVGFFSLPLARFQLESGEIGRALENSQRSLDIVSAHAKPDTFYYAVARHARGASLLAARRPAEALPHLATAAEILRKRLTSSHGLTQSYEADHALGLARAGRLRDAQMLLDNVLRQVPASPNPASTDRAGPDRAAGRPLYVLGVVQRLRGHHRAALRSQQQALQAMDGDRTAAVDTMRALTEIGLNLHALGSSRQAEAFLDQALQLSRYWQTETTPDHAEAIGALGRLRLANGRTAEGQTLLRETNRIRRHFGLDRVPSE